MDRERTTDDQAARHAVALLRAALACLLAGPTDAAIDRARAALYATRALSPDDDAAD